VSGPSSRSSGTWPTPRSGRWVGYGALAEERRYLDLDLNQELTRLEQLRREHLAVLEGLDVSGWERTGRHGEHGTMSVELYETHVAAEEVDHLAQLARLL
jgi:hypothetical protein